MARNHLRFSVDAWRDPDWLALSHDAQWLFIALLSQPKLTLIGSLDMTISKWAGLSETTTYPGVEQALAELEYQRFVVIDHRTDEVLIRSYAKNDLYPGRLSSQIAKGFWGAWKSLLSPHLRRQVVDNCPDDVWEKLVDHAPVDAVHIRRSRPIDLEPPSPIDSEPPFPIDNPASCILHPETSSQQQNAIDQTGVDNPPDERDAAAEERLNGAQRTRRFNDAIAILADRAVALAQPDRPDAYRSTAERAKRVELRDQAMTILDATPSITATELADRLEPPTVAKPSRFDPSDHQRAIEAEHQRNALRQAGEACDSCSGSGWVDLEDDDGFAGVTQCPDCIAPIEERVRQAMNGDPR